MASLAKLGMLLLLLLDTVLRCLLHLLLLCACLPRFELYRQCKVGEGTSFMITAVSYNRTQGAKRNYWVKVSCPPITMHA